MPPPVEPERRSAMRGGRWAGAVVACGVGAVVVWTMAAHDPYWRLFETRSVPAPAYDSPEEIRAVLASAVVATSHPDNAATRPEVPAEPGLDADALLAVLTPRPAEPLIAVLAPLAEDIPVEISEDVPGEIPGGVPGDIPRGVPGGMTAEQALPGTLAVAGPPAGLVPPPLAETVASGVRLAALRPVQVPEAPARLWRPADASSEEALALARAERANVQRRLALAGFDPGGSDGVFGPRTRRAIADFQEAWGFPSTGYLDSSVHAELEARTDEAYAALKSRAAAEPPAAPELAPVARERQLAAKEGCARDARGRIIASQSFGCDVKGLAEEVVSLGRNKLAHEEPGDVAVAGTWSRAMTSGADR